MRRAESKPGTNRLALRIPTGPSADVVILAAIEISIAHPACNNSQDRLQCLVELHTSKALTPRDLVPLVNIRGAVDPMLSKVALDVERMKLGALVTSSQRHEEGMAAQA